MYGGNPALALFERAMTALPTAPSYHEALRSVTLFDGLRTVAAHIGYSLT